MIGCLINSSEMREKKWGHNSLKLLVFDHQVVKKAGERGVDNDDGVLTDYSSHSSDKRSARDRLGSNVLDPIPNF